MLKYKKNHMLLLELLFIVLSGLILFLVCLIIIIKLFESYTLDAPFIGTEKYVVDEIVSNFGLNEKSILIDLGCGDGRILRHAVDRFKDISAIGIEGAIWPFLLAKFASRDFKQIQIKKSNIFDADVHNATHIYVYLYPECLNKLEKKFKEECQDSVRIISCDFEIKNLKLIDTVILENRLSKYRHRLFIYNKK